MAGGGRQQGPDGLAQLAGDKAVGGDGHGRGSPLLARRGLLPSIGALAAEYATYALVTRPGSLPGAILAAWYAPWPWCPTLALALVFAPCCSPPVGCSRPDGEVAQAGHDVWAAPMRIGEASSAKVTSDRAVADDRKTWPLHDRLDGQVVAPRSGQVLQRHSERIAEADNRAERGGRQSTGLDLQGS